MKERREYKRHNCAIPVSFNFYEGDPDNIDIRTAKPIKGKGSILDISCGGAYVVTNSRVSVNLPMIIIFQFKKKKYNIDGVIIRTGLVKNNPAEEAQKAASFKGKGDYYLGLRFNSPAEGISIE